VRAGELRHRCTIQQRQSVSKDSITGADVESWAAVLTDEPCSLHPLSVRELVSAQSINSAVSARAVIRYRSSPAITADMRLICDGVTYNIIGVQPDPTLRAHLTLMLEAGINDG